MLSKNTFNLGHIHVDIVAAIASCGNMDLAKI
jgi:hypothetical protein